MRRSVLLLTALTLPAFAASNAHAVSPGDVSFSVFSRTTLDEGDKHSASKSLFAEIVAKFIGRAETERSVVVASTSHDHSNAEEGCPESAENAPAGAAGEDDEAKKQLAGPEPIYFAF